MESVRFTGRVRKHFGRFDHVKPARTDRWTSLRDEITSRCDEKVKSKSEVLEELRKFRQASADILGPDAKHEDRKWSYRMFMLQRLTIRSPKGIFL